MKKTVKILSLILCFVMMFSCVSLAADTEVKPFENSEFFEYGDYTVHYRRFFPEGEAKGRIIMLHGFVCSTYAWNNMAAEMTEKGYECLLIDLPGFGYTTREDENTSFVPRETLVKELAETIAPMSEWIVAGHSMGGGVSMNIAVENPEIKALLLYCPAPINEMPQAMKGFMTGKFMSGLMNTITPVITKLTPLVRVALLMASMDWEFTKNYDLSGITVPMALPKTGGNLFRTSFTATVTDFEKVKELEMPILLVNATKDLILTGQMKEQVATELEPDMLYEVETGHFCIENRSEELADVTEKFLNDSL